MFRKPFEDDKPHKVCFENLAGAVAPFGIGPIFVPIAFNIFYMSMLIPKRAKLMSVRQKLRWGILSLFTPRWI